MDEFVVEVQEDIRREQALKFWRSYGKYIITLVVLLIVGTGGFLYWQEHQLTKQQEDALLYEQALSDQDPKLKASALKTLSTSASPGYRALALFEEAEHSGNPAAAYRALAGDKKLEPALKELASLKAILKDVGHAPAEALLNEVQLLVRNTGPWREQAFEIQAILLMETGRIDEAKRVFENLKASKVAPEGVRARASAMLDSLSK
ncbi:MAG: tetratricopeptide repeat protein [Alphaproteobacteria bacterium]|nr:tetratricopeptide repeat protein [Alphaproteobacteria bacterium]